MSLTGVAGPPGVLAAGKAGNAAAQNAPAGLPALFAALLAGQTAMGTDSTNPVAPQKVGRQENKGEHDKSDEDTNPSALPADPNAALLLIPVPLPALPAPLIVPSGTTTNPTAAAVLETKVSQATLAAPTETYSEVMDTAPAPALNGPQKSSELLPLPTLENAPVSPALVPSKGADVALPIAVPVSVGAVSGAVTPAPAIGAVTPAPTGAPVHIVAPRPVDAVRPALTPPAPPNTTVVATPPSETTAPAAVPDTQTATLPAAPVQKASTTLAASQVQTAAPAITPQGENSTPAAALPVQGTVHAALPAEQTAAASVASAAQTVTPEGTAPMPPAVPVPVNADKINSPAALQKPLVPANNTGRSLRSEGKVQDERATQAAPTLALAAGNSSQKTAPPRPAEQNADKEASAGFSDLPAQAPTLTAQATPALPAKPGTRGSAARQVAEEIVTLKPAPGATRQVVVNLHPRDWGQVRVEVTMAPASADGTAGAVTARLSADNPQARAALEASTGELKRILHDAGLHLDAVTVTDTVQAASQSAASGGSGTPFQPHDGGGQAAFQNGAAFTGGQNMASGGGQGGGSHGQQGRTASGPFGTAEPDTALPQPARATSQLQGVDIRA